MHQTNLIAHRWKYPPLKNQDELTNLLGQIGDAVLFHANKSGEMIDLLRERRAPAVLPLPVQQNAAQVNMERSAPVTDLFVKTYPKDIPWLSYCLRSAAKFAIDFRSIIIVSPNGLVDLFPLADFPSQESDTIFEWRWEPKAEYGNDGYLSQQVFKLMADTFTDADYILMIDSDTIFTCPVTPETFFTNGKIDWMMTPYDQTNTPWKPITEKFLKQPVEFEFMRRAPQCIPGWLYADLRSFCEREHGVTIDKYVMSQPYREFSEFNALGAFAYAFRKDKFNWINTDKVPPDKWPKLVVDQRYSHGGLTDEIRAEWEKILTGGHGKQKTQPEVRDSRPGRKPKPVRQPTLSGGETNKIGTDVTTLPDPPSLNTLLEQISKHFTSPLAKGRIFKRLKSFPIAK
jgi:hypothetical protein